MRRRIRPADLVVCGFLLMLYGPPVPQTLAQPRDQSTDAARANSSGGLDSGPELSFNDAWRKVRESSPALRTYESTDAAWGHRASQAGAFPNPAIALSMEDIGARDEFLGQSQWTFAVSQPIPLGSRLKAARRAEETARAVWVHEAAGSVVDFKVTLKQHFVSVLAGKQRLRALGNSVARFRAIQSVIESRVAAGALPRVRLQRVTQALSLENERIVEVEVAIARVLAEMPALWGGRSGDVVALAGDLGPPLPPSEMPLRLDLLSNTPALKGCSARADRWEAEVELREEQAIPDAEVAIGYRGLDGFGSHAAIIGFSVPLPLFDRNRWAVDEARAHKRAEQFACRGVRSRLEARASARHAQAAALHDQYVRTIDEIVPRATTAYAAALDALMRDEVDLNDILDLATYLDDVETRAVSVLEDYWMAVVDYETLTNTELLSFDEVTR